MLPPKKIPMRTCIACKTERPKIELLRVVRSPAGAFSLDFSGRAAGRGAYVCPDESCIKKLGQKKLLNRAFSAPVDDAVYRQIEEEFFGATK